MDLAPDLSGEYTCVVRSRGREARAASTMTVFSKFCISTRLSRKDVFEVFEVSCYVSSEGCLEEIALSDMTSFCV